MCIYYTHTKTYDDYYIIIWRERLAKKKKYDCYYFLSDKPDKSVVGAVSYAIIINNYSRTGTDEHPPSLFSGRPHFAVV